MPADALRMPAAPALSCLRGRDDKTRGGLSGKRRAVCRPGARCSDCRCGTRHGVDKARACPARFSRPWHPPGASAMGAHPAQDRRPLTAGRPCRERGKPAGANVAGSRLRPHEHCRPRSITRERMTGMASPAGFEPTAPRLGIWCSIRLSYGDTGDCLAHCVARRHRAAPHRPSPTNGLLRRSSPKLPPGPWPHRKTMSSPNENSLVRMAVTSASVSP